jgi:hypothetical protein
MVRQARPYRILIITQPEVAAMTEFMWNNSQHHSRTTRTLRAIKAFERG